MDSPAQITRRTVPRPAGVLSAAVAALEAAGSLAVVPQRALAAAAPSDIQFDISRFLAVPPQTCGSGVKFQMPPVLPKLQFTIFVPSAEFFRTLRTRQASLDGLHLFGVSPDANGLERFITATRRQNFLIPPRRHRAFPLVELT